MPPIIEKMAWKIPPTIPNVTPITLPTKAKKPPIRRTIPKHPSHIV